MKYHSVLFYFFTVCALLGPTEFNAQELEPRALTNLPKGLNFATIGYAYASGNTLMDPALPLKDFNGKLNTIVFAYAKSVNFFGASGKVDAILPLTGGDFNGMFDGEEFSDSYTGFGDLRIRASVNFTGAPSIEPSEFKDYDQKVVSGLAMQIIIPTGNYKKEQLPNLGSNRWALRMNYGISSTLDMWILEGHVGAWLFSSNNDFLGNNKLEQKPLWVLKGNIIRQFRNNGMWLAFSMGYGYGGQTDINNVRRDATISQLRLGLAYALPILKKNTLKFTVGSGIRFQEGGDFDLLGVTFSRKWLDKKKRETLEKKPK
jgi:hypothetical protein